MCGDPLPISVHVSAEGNRLRLRAHHLPAAQLHALLLQFGAEFGLIVSDLEDAPESGGDSLQFTLSCAGGVAQTAERLARLHAEKDLDSFWPGTRLEFYPPLVVGDLPTVDG